MNDAQWQAMLRAYEDASALLARPPGALHLLGIGGVGMAALAVQLQARGYTVTGCDSQPGRVAAALVARGIPVHTGHSPAHLSGREQAVIRSPAVRDDDPEWLSARMTGIPSLDRGVVLPALLRGRPSVAIAGSHGKTTTTAMLTHIFRATGRPAGFCIGGEIDDHGTVAEYSAEGPLIVEADESDGTLALYEAGQGIITNVEWDHVDYFPDETALRACFQRFASRTRGTVWFCADDPGARFVMTSHPRGRSFGCSSDAQLRAADVREEGLGIVAEVLHDGRALGMLRLQVPGMSNLLDALAALGVALEHGIPFGEAAVALGSFKSVRRRFECVAQGGGRTVISDYAHHPTEIRALMAQVKRLAPRRVLAVYQPHRYSRTAALAKEFPPAFAGVDDLLLAPVYAASERPVPGGRSEDLLPHFGPGTPPVTLVQSLLEAWELIRNKWREGDVLLVIGAGDVEQIAAWAARELGESRAAGPHP